MPVEFDSEIKRKEGLYEAFPEEITIRPELNGRHEKPEIEWLIKDIIERGQLQPVGIWKDGNTAVLSYGFSRWRAISEINKRKLTPNPLMIRCVLVKCNEQGAFIRNICENRLRNPVSAIDDAHNIDRLIEAWQMNETEVAKIYFPTASTEAEMKEALKFVRDRLALVKLTPEAEKAMREGRLNETAAQAIAKLSSAQQRKALDSKEGKISAADVKAVSPKSNRGRKPAEKPIDSELRRRITAVVESADWNEYDESKSDFIGVRAVDLAALKNYMDEK